MDQNYVQGLHSLLLQSTSNDTSQLQAATAKLNQEYYKNPACIPGLATVLASAPEQAVRQLAAVELRKRVAFHSGDLWTQVPPNEREQIKTKLLELIIAESANSVKHSSARVVAAIAAIEMQAGTWPQLLPFVHSTCTSSDVAQREAGSFILFTVLENVADGFQENMNDLLTLIEHLLADPASMEVRVSAVKSLGVLAAWLDADDKDDVRAIQKLVPSMFKVIGVCVESGDETSARAVFDQLETMLVLEVPVLGKHVPDLVAFLLQAGGNRSVSPEIRVLCLNALSWVVQYKKSKIQSNNLGPEIIKGLMPITTEEEPEDPEDEVPSRAGLRIFDSLSTKLPPSQVFPALREQLVQYFSSADANYRRGAMLALGISVEGCSEYMTPLMDEIWPMIEAGLQDSDASVRKATCVGISCLCDWLDEVVAAKHTTLLPGVMNLINDPATQKAACTALDSLLEIMQDDIHQYLELIMERLAGLLQVAPLNVKAVVTGAIGSAAHASKEKFLPYFRPTMDHIKQFLLLTEEGEELELRGITMDACGTFAEAVGKDEFKPYFSDLMTQAIEGLHMNNPRLRECSFLFFTVMARVFGEDFAPYLPEIVPSLISSCKEDETDDKALAVSVAEATSAFASGSGSSTNVATQANGEEVIELDEADFDAALAVNNAVAIEKEVAADTIGTLFAATGEHFLPYVESCTLQLVDLLSHYYEGIRKSATDSLLETLRTLYKLSNPPEWTAGLTVTTPLPQPVKDLSNHALKALLEMYDSEDDKSVASALCVGLAETIQLIGPALLEGYLDSLCNIAIQILEGKAYCQQDPDQGDDDVALEEQAEYDSVLTSSAGDLVAGLAAALGPDFVQAFGRFFPLISKYYKKGRSLSDRSSAIGCLSEVIAGMKSSVTPFTEPLLELFYRALGDKDGEVISNAAFATGLLIEHSETDLSPQYLQVLAALRPMFDVTPNSPSPKLNARDNAAGSISRMTLRNASAVPLDQVLPVVINALPLKNDLLENQPTFRMIFFLYRTNPSMISPFTQQLLPIFAQVLDPSSKLDYVTDEVRAELLQLVNALNAENPSMIQQAGLSAYLS